MRAAHVWEEEVVHMQLNHQEIAGENPAYFKSVSKLHFRNNFRREAQDFRAKAANRDDGVARGYS